MNKIRIAAAVLAFAFCMSGCSVITDTLSPKGPEGPRDPAQYSSQDENSMSSDMPESVSDKSDNEKEPAEDEESFTQVTDSRQGTEDILLGGAWVETGDGSALGLNEGSRSDSDEWYYGSSLWFERDGRVILTYDSNDVGGTYTIGDDLRISVSIESGNDFEDGMELSFALGSNSQYGLILYTDIDGRQVKYYSAKI